MEGRRAAHALRQPASPPRALVPRSRNAGVSLAQEAKEEIVEIRKETETNR
jgi:hypothetical protein